MKSAGDRIPNVPFIIRVRNNSTDENPFEWKTITSQDVFAKKRCVVFAIPGAFTPICSSQHLPGYEKYYDDIKRCGIDEVYCISVNDAFVMRQWGLHMNVSRVKLIPDGACLFTRGMGASCIWTSERGFGERSWRYAMVVNDMVIEKIDVEQPRAQNSRADPFKVTDAKHMLAYLKKDASH